MHFDTVLNVAWMLLGLLALGRTIRATFFQGTRHKRGARWLHVVGVALIVAALFPYISATDDVLRMEHFNSQLGHRQTTKQTQSDNLMRLYEAMDTPLVCRACEVALTFFFISLVFGSATRRIDRIAPSTAGRSPPVPAIV